MVKRFATMMTVPLAAAAVAFAQPGRQAALNDLDADGNGLYDDAERKALMDALQQHVPSLQSETFDVDGDGRVSVLEQAQGRFPLTMTIGEEFLASGARIPWAIDAFPEWIAAAYLQEDAQVGPVSELTPRGLFQRTATPTRESKLPRKQTPGGGIEFAPNSGQQWTVPGNRNARWEYRWTILTFRIDPFTGTDAETLLVDLNSGNGSGHSSPKIWYHMDLGLHVQYVGTNKDGLDRRLMVADNVVADGETWNVLVCGIRYGQMFASLNGVPLTTDEPQPERFSSELLPGGNSTKSYIGDPGQGHMAWALDALIFGMTEPTEAMVQKMTGWAAHRLGVQENLPEDHPYRHERPIIDAEDFPNRYVHDEEKWNEWGRQATDKSITRVNAGGERHEPEGFERVFFDDFRAYRVAPSFSGEGDLWQGPGWNTAVGVDAPLIPPGRSPNAYPHDAANQIQKLSLVPEGDRWRAGAIYTINDLGHGYTWRGPKIFRIRCMFPKYTQEELVGGLFPAFWSYDNDFLFWRTANRAEVDYFEHDGQNGYWLNGLSTHFHYSHIRDPEVNIHHPKPNGYRRYKVYGGEMTEEKSNIPDGLFVWDGQYHTWEWVIDEDMTYANVTIIDENGEERWVEIYRTPTSPTYLKNLDLQINMALKGRYGAPTQQEDFNVDFVEVLQKTEDLEQVPAPFTDRPRLTGSNEAGSTVTCEPNVEGVTDLRYFWFADDYPLTWGTSNSYTLTDAEAGKQIRCMVKAVGALDQPQAWSEVLR